MTFEDKFNCADVWIWEASSERSASSVNRIRDDLEVRGSNPRLGVTQHLFPRPPSAQRTVHRRDLLRANGGVDRLLLEVWVGSETIRLAYLSRRRFKLARILTTGFKCLPCPEQCLWPKPSKHLITWSLFDLFKYLLIWTSVNSSKAMFCIITKVSKWVWNQY